MVSEHVSDKPHNKREIEASLKEASERYDNALKTRDEAAFSDLLADNFATTGIEGKLRNKTEEMQHMMTKNLVILN